MDRRNVGLLLVALSGAGALTLGDARLARPAPVTLIVARTDVEIPADPWARVWDRATPVSVPLSAQALVIPNGGRKGALSARAMHDGSRLYVLAEWKDHSRDETFRGTDGFTDQVAVEFPAERGDRVPFFCMGDPQAHVNVWLWKASRQTDVDRGYQNGPPRSYADDYPFEKEDTFYPPRALGNVVGSTSGIPMENLIAGGYGSLTRSDTQTVGGRGAWKRGRWRVLFVRDLAAGGDNEAAFKVPFTTSIAFATWDGGAGERDGMKSVAQFMGLELTDQPLGEAPARRVPLVLAAVAILAAGAAAAAVRSRRGGVPAGAPGSSAGAPGSRPGED